MPVYSDPREREAVAAVLKEVMEYHQDLDREHIMEIVSHEAAKHGIQPETTALIVMQLLDEG